uniref:Propionate--CoA ligase n=1 Tax=Stegastes partitus TaxID=144197 RepID=A0A3B5AEH8_9TELE
MAAHIRTGNFGVLLTRCRVPGLGCSGTVPARRLSSVPPPGTWSSQLSRLPHRDLYRLSVSDPDRFWGSAAADRLRWMQPFQRVRDCELLSGRIGWFLGGRLNVSVNCLDVHVEKHPDRVALIWERDEPGTELKVTYSELLETTCRLANVLKSHGIHKGDRVAIYMPVSPMAVAAMLACARIGAVHTVVFAGFSAEALAGRIQDAGCKAVITCNQGVRGGRTIELKATVDAAVQNCATVQHVFVSQRTDRPTVMGPMDVPLEEVMSSQLPVCPPESLDSEDLLFLLYTSGSTGKPKGLVHTQAGYLLYASMTHQYVFDCRDGDVFGCVADVGWITGHSYVVYGPLCNGVTTVLFESTPVYPNPGRYWETVQRLRINQFYGAPTALRLLLKYDDSWVKKYDRSSLRTLGSVGEPINHEAWRWFHSVVGDGRCPLVDTWWQTETGGVCIAPRPAPDGAAILPAMAMRPFFGIQPVLMGEQVSRTLRQTEPELGSGWLLPFAFVVLKEDLRDAPSAVLQQLRDLVSTKIAKYAVPEHFLVVKRLPKTRSGKIMRRILRKVAMETSGDLGDVSTLDDPSVVMEILEAHEAYRKQRKEAQKKKQ